MNDNIVKVLRMVKAATVPQAETIVAAIEAFRQIPAEHQELAANIFRIDVDSRKRGPQQNPRKRKESNGDK